MVYPNNKYRYDCAVNIEDLVKLSDVMIEHSLGPNGGKSIPSLLFEVFVYCKFLACFNVTTNSINTSD
jgi:hypothetical protein